jgi:leucyl/phenylalanyl-tRNA--protein transferase
MHRPPTLGPKLDFPDPRTAWRGGQWDGLVAIGGDLRPERLLLAYRSGIFPWTVNPVTWWSPDPRAILDFGSIHIPRSLRALLRKRPWAITRDCAFRAVIEACAAPAPGRRHTWISPGFVAAYTRLHELGHAHSVECWEGSRLVGGIYGIAIGGLFAGESMFHRASNASKVALCHLIEHLRSQGFSLFDIQMLTPATAQLGAVEIPRSDYLDRLAGAVLLPCRFQPAFLTGFDDRRAANPKSRMPAG